MRTLNLKTPEGGTELLNLLAVADLLLTSFRPSALSRLGLGAEQPFQLIGRTDGRLTLADPATGQRVDLESFGPTNVAVFARFLAAGAPSPK